MQLTVHQSIVIHQLRVESVSNSSVLQIGTAGIVKALSNLYNTGGFTGPAPLPMAPLPATSTPLVPLAGPGAR
ncbi:spore germination protein GerPB [Paenibacillus ginsengihumi]|uniref:spore germination protein GerPB n=1 Tax=Paenibacillus ginsengihumi TaxID=431596 RepID=UPI0003724DF8|nr:spore germination protein GerPB [Paenibacillus ginsengihumi]